MKTSIRSALALLLASLPSVATANPFPSGGGHNGPDLNGESIPVQVDRLITKAEVGEKIFGCVGQVLTEISQQFYRSSEVSVFARSSTMYDTAHNNSIGRVDGSFYANYHLPFVNDYVSIQYEGYVKNKNTSEAFLSITFAKPNVYLSFSTPDFPFVRFDAEYADSVYDDLGNIDHTKVKVSNIRIYAPKELRIDEPLTNTQTGQKTALTMNVRQYVDCIKTSIQN